MARYAFVFPGQGSQKVGMGLDLYQASAEVRALFEQASSVLKRDIAKLCFEGPMETLTQTENAQPGIFLNSAAVLLLLQQAGIRPTLVAGHSLGEITAYYAAGVLSLESALQIVIKRGQAMAASYPAADSAMAAVIGLDHAAVAAVLKDYQSVPVVAANFNSPNQIVISGKRDGVMAASQALKAAGAKVIALPVSGAFHSPLMQMGSDQFNQFLQTVAFEKPTVPIVLNRTGQPETDTDALKRNLPLQMVSSVQWVNTVAYLIQHTDCIMECGPGKVLTGLIGKCAPSAKVITISDMAQLNDFISESAKIQ